MKLTRLNWLTLVVVALFCAVAAWYYPVLPDPVPTHWNAAGDVDGWTAKPWGVWIMPTILLVLSAILFALPAISPRGFRLDAARHSYDIIVLVIVLFTAAIGLVSFESVRGGSVSMAGVLPWLLGMLFVALGYYLPRFPRNFFIGIRTPWTLASDRVWSRTHRLAGWLMMAAGVFLILNSVIGNTLLPGIVGIGVAVVVPVLYSLFLYRKLHGFKQDDER
jgi:uncharacterized membrane protein